MSTDRKAWFAKAIVVSVAGLIFSLLLSCAILLGSAVGLPGMAAVQRAGVDASMLAFVTFPWITDGPGNDSRRYVFVDVDTKACRQFAAATICDEREPVPVPLVADFLRAAENAGAEMLIIDVLPDDERRQRDLLATLHNVADGSAGPWIIGLFPSRSELVAGHIEEMTDLHVFDVQGRSRLRLASAVTTSDEDTFDGVIRRYPLLSFVKVPGSAVEQPIPTVPFLAAMLAEPRTAQATDCYFYRPTSCRSSNLEIPRKLKGLIALGEDEDLDNRIFYTLPGLSVRNSDAPLNAGVYIGRYDRFVASDLLTKGRFDIPQDALRGRIVILGSSAQQAEDWHMTPIGPMSGAEVVLNATRAILEYSAIGAQRVGRPQQFLQRFLERLRAALIGFVVFVPAWITIFWLNARTWRSSFGSVVTKTGLVLLVFCGALGVALLVEFSWSVSELRHSAETGVETDMITPIVALGLEGFAEAAKIVSRLIERSIEWLAALLIGAVLWLWTKISS